MSRKFTGFGALGQATPEMRSAFINIKRSLRSLAQTQRSAPNPNEAEVARQAGVSSLRSSSSGSKPTVVTFGMDVDKPSTNFLLTHGTGAFLYIATDTNKVYMWNGTAYKSATFT